MFVVFVNVGKAALLFVLRNAMSWKFACVPENTTADDPKSLACVLKSTLNVVADASALIVVAPPTAEIIPVCVNDWLAAPPTVKLKVPPTVEVPMTVDFAFVKLTAFEPLLFKLIAPLIILL